MTVPCYDPDDLWKHLNNYGCKQHEEYTKEFFDKFGVVVYHKDGFILPIKSVRFYTKGVAHRICDAFDIPYPNKKMLQHTDFRDN